ncbi:MAG TPA: hypothetical protein VFP43_11250 [Mesorhizobium sp.]|nr:hypothetical protein [Mesorhizobium sp.]
MQIILINIVLSGDNAVVGGVFKVVASYIRVRRRRPLRTSSQVVAEPQTAKP